MLRLLAPVAALPLLGAAVSGGGPRAAPATYQIVPASSLVRIEVGRAGLFGFAAGHTHEVEGPIRGTISAGADDLPHAVIRIDIPAAGLRVTGKGEPPGDVPKVQERMQGSEVLDVARYPSILFRSTSIAVAAADKRPDVELRVTGELTLRGRTKVITVPVHARLDAATLSASGTMTVAQTDFGIKPINIGGVVAVKDALTVHFTIRAAS